MATFWATFEKLGNCLLHHLVTMEKQKLKSFNFRIPVS